VGDSKDESNIKKTYNFSPFIEVVYAFSSLELLIKGKSPYLWFGIMHL
jgi:hypothetical protein